MTTYYEALPIYRTAADLAVRLDATVRGFERYHKYSIGQRMRDASLDIALLVVKANRRITRHEVLPQLCDKIEDLTLLLNLGKEMAAFPSFQHFVDVMEQVVSLARQAEGWRKSSSRPTGPEPGTPAASRRAT